MWFGDAGHVGVVGLGVSGLGIHLFFLMGFCDQGLQV